MYLHVRIREHEGDSVRIVRVVVDDVEGQDTQILLLALRKIDGLADNPDIDIDIGAGQRSDVPYVKLLIPRAAEQILPVVRPRQVLDPRGVLAQRLFAQQLVFPIIISEELDIRVFCAGGDQRPPLAAVAGAVQSRDWGRNGKRFYFAPVAAGAQDSVVRAGLTADV